MNLYDSVVSIVVVIVFGVLGVLVLSVELVSMMILVKLSVRLIVCGFVSGVCSYMYVMIVVYSGVVVFRIELVLVVMNRVV